MVDVLLFPSLLGILVDFNPDRSMLSCYNVPIPNLR
jgi:hypothetical protein